MSYFIKTPVWLQKVFPHRLWKVRDEEKCLYLTFDDGPHPQITSEVLKQLEIYNAKATFFCIGKNVAKFPGTYSNILNSGHTVGNHTYDHLNGWKIENEKYLSNILQAKKLISSKLFRPPYGRITSFQAKQLGNPLYNMKVVMWSVLSGDFDINLSKEKCCKNVLKTAETGDIIVFHDSEKAAEKMLYSLPKVLEAFTEKGYSFKGL